MSHARSGFRGHDVFRVLPVVAFPPVTPETRWLRPAQADRSSLFLGRVIVLLQLCRTEGSGIMRTRRSSLVRLAALLIAFLWAAVGAHAKPEGDRREQMHQVPVQSENGSV